MSESIVLDKSGYQVNIFFISQQKRMLWYSLEVPQRGASNEYHNICFVEKYEKYQYWKKRLN